MHKKLFDVNVQKIFGLTKILSNFLTFIILFKIFIISYSIYYEQQNFK